jgi:hypothetical protein
MEARANQAMKDRPRDQYPLQGMAFEPGSVRVDRLEEALGILDLLFRDALWATFVVQAAPAVPQHCHPRARLPCRGARRCHSRGRHLVDLWGWR